MPEEPTTSLLLMRITCSPAFLSHLRRNGVGYIGTEDMIAGQMCANFWDRSMPMFPGDVRPAQNRRTIMTFSDRASSLGYDVLVELFGPHPGGELSEVILEEAFHDELAKKAHGAVADTRVIVHIHERRSPSSPIPIN